MTKRKRIMVVILVIVILIPPTLYLAQYAYWGRGIRFFGMSNGYMSCRTQMIKAL